MLKNISDEASLIEKIPFENIDAFMKYAQGRMKKKVMAAIEAINGGVKEVGFGDARIPKPIHQALKGKGTVIFRQD